MSEKSGPPSNETRRCAWSSASLARTFLRNHPSHSGSRSAESVRA